jgi:hypothetical protein
MSDEVVLSRLADLEKVIERGLTHFVEVGNALLEIRESRLYQETHRTFEAYCKERWGMSRPRAYQLIEAAEVTGRMSTVVDKPTHESQVRPLTALPEEKQAAAWQEAVDTAPEGRVTARHTQGVADRLLGEMREIDACMARHYTVIAINQLEKITKNDPTSRYRPETWFLWR